jgi:transposase
VNAASSDHNQEELKRQEARIIVLQGQLSAALQEVSWAKLKIQSLEEKLRQERIARFGPRSEKLSDLQMMLLGEEPSVTLDEVSAEAGREPLPEVAAPVAPAPKRARKPHPGRQQLPAHLPRKEEVIQCTPEACQCRSCGQPTVVIGYDESEQLDVEPARYFVQVTKREKRACRQCAERSVVAAPLPERIIEKGLVSDRVVVDTIIKKYCDHLPLYRQEAIWQREAGVEFSRATLDGWVMQVGELLIPVREAMRQELLARSYLQADETTVLVQTREKQGAHHEAYLWQFGWPGGGVVFEFAMGRGRDVAARFLGNWEGKLQSDGYVGYDKIGGPGLLHYGCWGHARRYYVDAVKINVHDAAATQMVLRMDALFAVDREAKRLGLTGPERLGLRQEQGRSWLEEIRTQSLELVPRTLPKSKLGEALTYTINQWDRLARTFHDGEVELSNNIAENSMRPWALGRKNWLQVGSVKAGPKIAAIASVVESCRRLCLPVAEYLLDVLPGLASRPVSQVAQLTPARWAAERPKS